TPVIASRIPGNIGMLGAGYAGYFDWNDAAQLVHLLRRCRAGLSARSAARDPLYRRLQKQCAQRSPLFTAEAEQAALLKLLAGMVARLPERTVTPRRLDASR
ncbi:MAG: hypothetical protein ABJB04_01400, partial [Betaproteobacteria bacterium]